jgi:hypothetical protein
MTLCPSAPDSGWGHETFWPQQLRTYICNHCLPTGVWAHHAQSHLGGGDPELTLRAKGSQRDMSKWPKIQGLASGAFQVLPFVLPSLVLLCFPPP